jgi:transcriptional regulator GlxA family with amidase domain
VTRRIGIIVFEDVNLIDVSGPAQVFQTAAEQLGDAGACAEPAYEIQLLSRDGGMVTSSPGVRLETRALSSARPGRFDTVLVAGGHGADAAAADSKVRAWVARAAGGVRRLGSVCTGAFVLAESGVLAGRRAATHWAHCDRLQTQHPEIEVERDAIFVEDRGLWSSAGVTSGMDLALAMVEQDWGRDLALVVARRLVIFVKRPGGQSQFSAPLRSQAAEGPLATLLQWIVDNPAADLRAEALAERANMSLRTFFRAFSEATSTTPAGWVEMTRVECARRLLEQTEADIKRVALQSGFLNDERMRRAFVRRIGVSPAAYRSRFRREGAHDARTTVSVLARTGQAG